MKYEGKKENTGFFLHLRLFNIYSFGPMVFFNVLSWIKIYLLGIFSPICRYKHIICILENTFLLLFKLFFLTYFFFNLILFFKLYIIVLFKLLIGNVGY